MEYLPLNFCSRIFCRPYPKIGIILGCLSALDGYILLLMTLHTLVTGHGEIKLELGWKSPPCWRALTMLDKAEPTARGKRRQWSYSPVDGACVQQ